MLRCEITGNPCNTDTRPAGAGPCCTTCAVAEERERCIRQTIVGTVAGFSDAEVKLIERVCGLIRRNIESGE